MRHAWETGKTCIGFRWEIQRERDQFEDKGVDGKMESKWTLGRLAGGGADSPCSG
jgi:hypothetical protein